jgi:LPXTG-motif cell wall-anchored protein
MKNTRIVTGIASVAAATSLKIVNVSADASDTAKFDTRPVQIYSISNNAIDSNSVPQSGANIEGFQKDPSKTIYSNQSKPVDDPVTASNFNPVKTNDTVSASISNQIVKNDVSQAGSVVTTTPTKQLSSSTGTSDPVTDDTPAYTLTNSKREAASALPKTGELTSNSIELAGFSLLLLSFVLPFIKKYRL